MQLPHQELTHNSIAMFKYKDEKFYNDYFAHLSDFDLTDEFILNKDKTKYIGTIALKDTSIHSLNISIEIPKEFPHKKMEMWTQSLENYPHLIYDYSKESSWFCLNSPFAETAFDQLEVEMERLRLWIKRYMRKDLPAFIDDPKAAKAIYFDSAYTGISDNQMDEYRADSKLIFMGDFALSINNFTQGYEKDKRILEGTFHTVHNPNGQFFVFKEKAGTNHELPYIIVEDAPIDITNFLELTKQYSWSDETCDFLLPGLKVAEESRLGDYVKDFWDGPKEKQKETLIKAQKEVTVLPEDRRLFDEGIENLTNFNPFFDPKAEELESEDEIQAYEEYQRDLCTYRHFALGVLEEEKIDWLLIYTRPGNKEYRNNVYDAVVAKISIEHLINIPLKVERASVVLPNSFFGRGKLSNCLSGKKIALIGLGAIGSQVALSLARSGIRYIGIWDSDVVEPGNICRSEYTSEDLGNSKIDSLQLKITKINPYCTVIKHGGWSYRGYSDTATFQNGSFYGEVNYNNQEDSIKQITDFDLIIDCTASNEILHFISYAFTNKPIISLCITNRAQDMLCISSKDGNPFELRKAFLSSIIQDTKHFYYDGTGCYSPTFLAKYCDIAALVNLALRYIDKSFEKEKLPHSAIWSYTDEGEISTEKLSVYQLQDYDITLVVGDQTIWDGIDCLDEHKGELHAGYFIGTYSKDGKMIIITQIVDSIDAKKQLEEAFHYSHGINDYLGDLCTMVVDDYIQVLASKAADPEININNPLLGVKDQDGSIRFFLFINGGVKEFYKILD